MFQGVVPAANAGGKSKRKARQCREGGECSSNVGGGQAVGCALQRRDGNRQVLQARKLLGPGQRLSDAPAVLVQSSQAGVCCDG